MRIINWLPAFVWAGVIFFLSGRTGNELHSLLPFFTSFNWGHLVAYFVLGLCVYYALKKTFPESRIGMLTVVICLLYGISDEFHQSFVPGRTPQLGDLFNDGLGAFLGVLVWGKKINQKK